MTTLNLQVHANTPCPWIDSVTATVGRNGPDSLHCRFLVRGQIERLRIPSAAIQPARTDGLWRHTCFELFARRAPGSSYAEFNFSPSGHWAAYHFDGYRQGMRELAGAPPLLTCAAEADSVELVATLTSTAFDTAPARIAVAAVIEDRDGMLSYWALQHPDGKPDFHHDAGFTVQV